MSTEKFQNKYRIKSQRATWHDYNGGAYFITICTKRHEHFFGEIENGVMQLSEIGKFATENLLKISNHYPYAEIPLFVVMPNHFHAIIMIDGDKTPYMRRSSRYHDVVETGRAPSLPDTPCSQQETPIHEQMQRIDSCKGWLSVAIGGIKSAVTKFANNNGLNFAWQARFHDTIIRNQIAMNQIANYIENNVLKWNRDCFNKKIKMNNPWLNIPHSDYENHMTEVGQAQILNHLTKYYLNKYLPKKFALLGCATGNGLEHIQSEFTKDVYAIDINQNYLNKTKENFADKITNLEIINIDIRNDELKIKNINLFFIGLVLEYVEPKKVLEKTINTLSDNGVLLIVIQKSNQTSFVSKTKYKSLEKLECASKEVDENEIDKFIHSKTMLLINREEYSLMGNKLFIVLEYIKDKS